MAPGVSSCHFCEVPPSVSFSGSGFMATYQLGVAQCLLNCAPWILHTAPCILGASAGSLVAAAVVCEISLITIRDEVLNFAKQTKAFTFGPFNPSINVFHWLKSILHKYVSSDAHQLANGRLAVAMTRLTDSKLFILSEFQSKEDVVQALLCSCFVPGYCGMMPPSFKGVRYIDGGFSSMQPVLAAPCSPILTVSPFSGQIDICPADTPSMWDIVVGGITLKGNMANSFRIINALYPMASETLEQAYDSGYKDAINFLRCNNLAPHFRIHRVSQGQPNSNQTKTGMHLKTNIEEEEEMKMEKEPTTLTSYIDSKGMQTGSSTEHEQTGNRQTKEPPLHFDMIKDVLLGNVSMFGVRAKILSHLLLPLMLWFYALLQTWHRLELMFWVCYGLRHYTVFFFNIFVCSLQKNIEDRIIPNIWLLQWLKMQAQYEAPQGQRHATPYHKFHSSSHLEDVRRGRHRRFITPSQDYKKPKLQYI